MKKIAALVLFVFAVSLFAIDAVVCDACGHLVETRRAKKIRAEDSYTGAWFRTFCEADAPKCDLMRCKLGEWTYFRTNAEVEINRDGSEKKPARPNWSYGEIWVTNDFKLRE
jgi:hypothetical protein